MSEQPITMMCKQHSSITRKPSFKKQSTEIKTHPNPSNKSVNLNAIIKLSTVKISIRVSNGYYRCYWDSATMLSSPSYRKGVTSPRLMTVGASSIYLKPPGVRDTTYDRTSTLWSSTNGPDSSYTIIIREMMDGS